MIPPLSESAHSDYRRVANETRHAIGVGGRHHRSGEQQFVTGTQPYGPQRSPDGFVRAVLRRPSASASRRADCDAPVARAIRTASPVRSR